MTTKVTVEPSGHRIEITVSSWSSSETSNDNISTRTNSSQTQTIILEPTSPPWTGYIHQTQNISVREMYPNENANCYNSVSDDTPD